MDQLPSDNRQVEKENPKLKTFKVELVLAVGAALGSPVANEGSPPALWPAALGAEGWSGLYPVPQQSLGHSVQTDACLLRGQSRVLTGPA